MANNSNLTGSSGRVSYSDLAPGRYTLRVVAKASKGQRAVIRRTVHIGE